MTEDKSIFIKNIYYMLSYAFEGMQRFGYEEMAGEHFENAQDLFAAILCKGVARQLKQGLYREYTQVRETLPGLRGKLELTETIRCSMRLERKLACVYDTLSADNLYNRVLKTTMHYLLADEGVAPKRRAALKRLLVYFDEIGLLVPSQISWSSLHYRRGNQSYALLMNICHFVLDGLLQTTESGAYRMMQLSDAHMARLYERFILSYYRRHHTYLSQVRAGQIVWDLTEEAPASMLRLLPVMQTDIMLRQGEKTLIIDAKYYGQTLQKQFDKSTLHSANLYQIFTYVKNEDAAQTGQVAGLLLYAKTQEEIAPDCLFHMGGNLIGARTLDLNQDFAVIADTLDRIAHTFFDE